MRHLFNDRSMESTTLLAIFRTEFEKSLLCNQSDTSEPLSPISRLYMTRVTVKETVCKLKSTYSGVNTRVTALKSKDVQA